MRNHKSAAFLPVRRRSHQRSLSVIPNSIISREFFVAAPLHKRSRSVTSTANKSSESTNDALRFFFGCCSTNSLALGPLIVEPTANTTSDRTTLSYQPQKSRQNAMSDMDDDLNDFFCDFSLAEKENQSTSVTVEDHEDCCPLTPQSQISSSSCSSLSPPPIGKPCFVFLDISSAADSGLFLPDSF